MSTRRKIQILPNFRYMFEIPEREDINFYEINQGRKSAKTTHMSLAFAYYFGTRPKTGLVVLRKNTNDLKDSVIKSITKAINGFNIHHKFNKSDKEWVNPANGNTIQARGIYTSNSSKIALAGTEFDDVDLAIVWIDEAHEITEEEWYAILEAYRGTRVVFVRTSNPKSKSNWYVSWLSMMHPYNRGVLVEKGEDIKILPEHKTMIHYGNFRINSLLEGNDINNLLRIMHFNPRRWEMAGNGMPGNEGKTIYANLMRQKNNIEWDDNLRRGIREFHIGLDFGWRRDYTTATLGGFTNDYKEVIAIEDMPPIKHEDANTMSQAEQRRSQAEQIVDWIKVMRKKYGLQGKKIYVHSDYATEGTPLIQACNQQAHREGLQNSIKFIPAIKKPITYRIRLLQNLMEQNRLLMVSETSKHLIQDLNNAEWVKDKEGEKRADGDDHYLNAFEYMVSAKWRSLWNNTMIEEDKWYD